MTRELWVGADPNPNLTERRVLLALAEGDASRRELTWSLYGNDNAAPSSHVGAALHWLRAHKMIESAYDPHTMRGARKFRVTTTGKAWIELIELMDEAS